MDADIPYVSASSKTIPTMLIITRAIREAAPRYGDAPLDDGDAALALLAAPEALPDLILLDINMPGLSGSRCWPGQSRCRLKRIPVVMLTSSDCRTT